MKVTELEKAAVNKRAISSLNPGWYLHGNDVVLVIPNRLIYVECMPDGTFVILNPSGVDTFLPITVEEMLIRRK